MLNDNDPKWLDDSVVTVIVSTVVGIFMFLFTVGVCLVAELPGKMILGWSLITSISTMMGTGITLFFLTRSVNGRIRAEQESQLKQTSKSKDGSADV